MRRSLLTAIIGLTSLCTLSLAPSTSAQSTEQVRLTLSDCRRLALENNLDLRVSRLSPVLSRYSVDAAMGTFDPRLTASINYSASQPPDGLEARFNADSTLTYIPVSRPSSRSVTSRFGVSKMFGFGTELSAGGGNTWSEQSSNKNVQSYLYMNVRQPLLDGLGRDANEGNLRIARSSLAISESQFEQSVTSTIQTVETAYWSLVAAYQDLDVSRLSLREAERLLETSRTGAEIGTRTQSDVIEAESRVATVRYDIIVKTATVRDRADNLRRVLNLTESGQAWDTELVPVDTPTVQIQLPPLDSAVARAIRNREDIQQSRISIETERLRVRMNQNSRLPSLDVTGSLQISDSDRDLAGSVDNMQEFRDWTVGLEFSMPIGNHSADAAYQRAVVGLREAELSYAALEQQIQSEVRSAYRSVQSTSEQIASAQIALRLSETRLEIANEKLRAGLFTTYDVIQAEGDLATARKTYLNAQIQHQNALIDLDVATGAFLENRRIQLTDSAGL